MTGAAGKGFVSASIIAKVLNGDPFPGDPLPSDRISSEAPTAKPAAGNTRQPAAGDTAARTPLPVIVVASDRDTFDSIVPRVEAAGGDTERLQVLPFFALDDEWPADPGVSRQVTRNTRKRTEPRQASAAA